MNVEFSLCNLNEFLLGIMTASGEDEYGEFSILSIGLLFFKISIYIYK